MLKRLPQLSSNSATSSPCSIINLWSFLTSTTTRYVKQFAVLNELNFPNLDGMWSCVVFSMTGTRYPNTSRNFWVQNYRSRQLQVQSGFDSFIPTFCFPFFVLDLVKKMLFGVLLLVIHMSWEILKKWLKTKTNINIVIKFTIFLCSTQHLSWQRYNFHTNKFQKKITIYTIYNIQISK